MSTRQLGTLAGSRGAVERRYVVAHRGLHSAHRRVELREGCETELVVSGDGAQTVLLAQLRMHPVVPALANE